MSERDDAPRPDARADAGPRELDLFDLAAFVWTQKLVAILVAVLVFLPLAGLVMMSIKPSWVATSRLLVILDPTDLTPGAAGSGGAFIIDTVMQSEAEILNSDAVRRVALADLNGTADPLLVRSVARSMKVQRAPNASVLNVTYAAADPGAAATVLNAVVDAYLAYRTELLIGGVDGGVDDRLAAAEAEAARAEDALRRFLNANALSDFQTERQAVLQRISDLEARRLSADAEAATARGFAAALAERIARLPEEIALYVENGVSGQLLALEVRREELLARYLPDAPPVQAVEREIAALSAFLDAGGAEGRGQTRTGVNPVWQALEQERLQQEAFASSQERLTAALQIQLRAARAEADRLRGLSSEYERLVRSASARSEAARALSVEAADADSRRNAPPGAADAVRVVERAAPPVQPKSLLKPALAAVFVMAVGLGVFVALLRGYLIHRATLADGGDGPRPHGHSRTPARRARPRRKLPVLARVGSLEAGR